MSSRRRVQLPLLGVLALLFLASLFLGRYPRPHWMPVSLPFQEVRARRLVLHLRLPRIVTACLLGAALSAAGAVLQMAFRNPLIEPGFLGVSQGAAFGAALGILFLPGGPLVNQLAATVCASLALVLSDFLARRVRYGGWTLRLVLAGIAVAALFSAGLGLLKYVADPLTELPAIVFWSLGALWGITWADVMYVVPLVVPALATIYLMRWRLNLLSLPDEIAFSLGTSPDRERTLLLAAAVVAVASIVSVAGIVGWVGLMVPHTARRLVGADASRAIPVSMLVGAVFALVCDNLARSSIAGEIPLGILTALFGAGFFLLLLTRRDLRLR